MAEENARLARRERLDLVPTEVLGLFVVGRLARRHGMRVTLTPSAGGGVTAELEVPERLLVVDVTEPRVVAVARARVGAPESVIAPPAAGVGGRWPPPHPGRPTGRTGAGARSSAAPAAAPAPRRHRSGPAPEWPIRRRTPADRPPPPVEEHVVDAADRRATARSTSRRHGAEGQVVEGQVVDENGEPTGPAYDEAAFSRAKQMIGAGQPWNAFVPQPRTTQENAGGHNGANERPVKEPSGLRQRVPGAQLPPRGGRRTLPRPSVPDPAEARALIEAVRGRRQATPSDTSAPRLPGRHGPYRVPRRLQRFGHGGHRGARGDTGRGARPGRRTRQAAQAPLRRRQPGATLEATPQTAEPSATELPLDPDEARDLVQEFEAGVARAMRKIGAGLRDEEESPR